jgi:cysteine desulfurase
VLRLPVYMDHHATTPVDPRVLEVMLPYFTETFGNAASKNHAFGWRAEEAVHEARAQVARAIGASASEIVFTSGATESDNLMLKGAAQQYRDKGDHIVTVATEHKAVLDPCHALEAEGFRVTVLPPLPDGRLDLDALEAAVDARTILVSVMWANNEIGTVHPMQEIARRVKAKGALLAVDAAQAVGKIALDVEAAQVDLLSISGHKVYGPKGVGALYVRKKPRVRLVPMIDGGGHEKGLRSGTLNVPGIVGLGAALALAETERETEAARLLELRNRLDAGIRSRLPGVYVNGTLAAGERLPGNLNLSFDGVEGEALLLALKDVAVSSGSACSSASIEPSHVIRALGHGNDRAHASVRFGLGRFNTEEEVDFVVDRVVATVERLRALGGDVAHDVRDESAGRSAPAEAPLRVRDR